MRYELGTSARRLGLFRASAANESGRDVLASVYAVAVAGVVIPRAEMAKLLWLDPQIPAPRVGGQICSDLFS